MKKNRNVEMSYRVEFDGTRKTFHDLYISKPDGLDAYRKRVFDGHWESVALIALLLVSAIGAGILLFFCHP